MGKSRLTIGMAVYDDFDGLYFTIQSLRLYHASFLDRLDFLVIDNHPSSTEARACSAFLATIPNASYVPFTEFQGTACRDVIFRLAKTSWVLCMDAHLLLAPGALQALFTVIDQNPGARDLLQGPLLHDDGERRFAYFEPQWQEGMYGYWSKDVRTAQIEGPPFEIPMQGLGLFACRKDAWPGFNPRFRGFGGEEGYIHEKFRQRGQKVYCLPACQWMHRFQRPHGVNYRNRWQDRVRNYYLGFMELGLNPKAMETHFNQLLGMDTWTELKQEILLELSSPLIYFDAVYWAPGDLNEAEKQACETIFKNRNSDYLLRKIEEDFDENILLQQTGIYGFRSVLLIKGAAVLDEILWDKLRIALPELVNNNWDTFEWKATGDLGAFEAWYH